MPLFQATETVPVDIPPGSTLQVSLGGLQLSGNTTVDNPANSTIQVTVIAPLPPPTGSIPDVVERWLLNEASGTRAGSMPTTPAVNPGRIDLDDNGGVGSLVLADHTTAAHITAGTKLTDHPSNSAGRRNNPILSGGSGSWSLFFRLYFPAMPSVTESLFGRDSNNSWNLLIQTFPKNLTFTSKAARATTFASITNPVELSANVKYSVALGYNAATGKTFLVVVSPSGLTRTESAVVGRRSPDSAPPLSLGDYRGDQPDYALQDVWYHRAALDDSTIQFMHNGGTPLTFGASILAPPRSSGLAPFTVISTQNDFETSAGIISRGGCPQGLYFYRPFPLFQWSPSLAASHGNYVWVHSSDHSQTGTNDVSGVWIGFSGDPGTRPATWQHVIPGTGSASGRNFVQLETPHLCYVPSDPNSRPFYCYAHGDVTSGGPAGLDSCQETFLWTSADLINWTSEGVAIPCGTTPVYHNHTGYATVYPPNSLPGQTDWRAYSLGYSQGAIEYCTPSSTGKLFNLGDDPEELDYCSPFPAGYDLVQWRQNVFTFDGATVYGIGQAFMPSSRGVALSKLAFENGAWRQATGQVWPIASDGDVFPTVGYTQDMRAYADPSTKIVHVYILKGFFPQSADERINYLRLQF